MLGGGNGETEMSLMFCFSSQVLNLLFHSIAYISDINYFGHIKYFIILTSELNRLPLNPQSLGFHVSDNNSIFPVEAWGCLASPFLSLPHSLKYRILALPMPGGCLSTLPRPEQAVFISVCPLHQLPDHSSCSSGYPLPPPAPPSTAAPRTFSRADLLLSPA